MATKPVQRALIFSLAYYPHLIGGAEVAVKEITDRVSPTDVEFDMVTLYAGSSRYERIGNINVYRVGPKIRIVGSAMPNISYLIKFYYVVAAFFKAISLHRKRHYDFTWSIMASFNAFSNLFFKLIYRKIPFMLTLQEGDTYEHIKKSLGFMHPIYLKIFQKADYLQSISYFLENYGKSLGAMCPSSVVPNGVNFKFFSTKPTLGQLKALAHELGIDPFDTVLITTSRLVQKNGIGDVIEALVHLPKQVKFVVLGTGPLEKLLKDKTSLLKLGGRVKFVGFVPHREVPIYLHLGNIFVRPSLSEGFGVSFVEAMAADLPVIATPVGGIVDFLVDRKTGIFCEVENPRSIMEKVELVMNNKELRENIIKNAKTMVREEYDWDLIAFKMKGIFEGL